MSPMSEFDLRRELQAVEPAFGAPAQALSEQVIQRGRAVRRRNTVISTVAVALVAAGAIGASAMLPQGEVAVPAETVVSPTPTFTESPSPDSEPSPSATASASTSSSVRPTPPAMPKPTDTKSAGPAATSEPSETATRRKPVPGESGPTRSVPDPGATSTAPAAPSTPPARVWDSRSELPDNAGDLGAFRLPHEGQPADGEASAWTSRTFPITSCAAETNVGALTSIVGGKTIAREGPDWLEFEGVLVFRDEDGARQFMRELHATQATCTGSPQPSDPETDERGRPLSRSVYQLYGGPDDAGQTLTIEYQDLLEGEYRAAPGSVSTLWARSGRAVAMVETSSTNPGNPVENDAGGFHADATVTLESIVQEADRHFN